MRKGLIALLLAVVAGIAFSAPASGGGAVQVKNGVYAGGAKRLFVYFNVQGRSISYVRVKSERLDDCAASGPAVFDPSPVNENGRFNVRETIDPENDIKVTGRFVRPREVEGKIKWTTTDDCPVGTYRFEFRADRYGPA